MDISMTSCPDCRGLFAKLIRLNTCFYSVILMVGDAWCNG